MTASTSDEIDTQSKSKNKTPLFLHDVWSWYFHDPDDADWTLGSYMRVGDVSTLDDFWNLQLAVDPYVRRGMFFVMREHIFPCWDDPHNIKGGCLSIKVLNDEMPSFWQHLLTCMLGERLATGGAEKGVADDGGDVVPVVNGLSVSPKRFFCIIKVWLRSERYTDPRYFRLPPAYNGEILYRSNMENINDNRLRDVLRNAGTAAVVARAPIVL